MLDDSVTLLLVKTSGMRFAVESVDREELWRGNGVIRCIGDERPKFVVAPPSTISCADLEPRRNLHTMIPAAGMTTARVTTATIPIMVPADSDVFPCGGV